MRYYVEINDEMLKGLDGESIETCQYDLSNEQVADLRDYVEALGYDWNEIAYVCIQWAA
jgi:hypothetical protein